MKQVDRAARLLLAVVAGAAAAALPVPAAAFDGMSLDGTAFDSTAARQLTGAAALAAAPPAGFVQNTAFSGLIAPTKVEFAPDGQVFVAEKRGRILQYDSLADTTPSVFADLRQNVLDSDDRGLLGLAIDPRFAQGSPYVYALYTYDKDPFVAQFPRWNDNCPTPPGPTADGCVASGRLARLRAGQPEQVLLEGWCQQYTSHSVGDLAFGPDGALYVSAGDGASYTFADYGQDGSPVNPCGDPPGGRGGAMTAPTAEGGALRSQDVRTTGDPASGSGAVLRIDPATGDALPDNPNAASSDPWTRRIVAYGFRNPFRIAFRPGTSELWLGDVGWNDWEELDRIQNPRAAVTNYGWPCYEGAGRMGAYDNLNLNLCESLYNQGSGAHSGPYFAYSHSARVVAGETCSSGTSSISGLAFNDGVQFPERYRNGLFFTDYARSCIWFMPAGADGLPNPNQRETFVTGAQGAVSLTIGPDGALYFPNIIDGTIQRVSFPTTNHAPTARAAATPTSGAVPLTVQFDGSGSSDGDGDPLAYAWDLDGDGAFDDSTAQRPTRTYTTPGAVTVRLRVTDPEGLEGVDQITISAGTPPTAEITAPSAGATWTVGDTIAFSGRGVDGQGNPLPASRLSWRTLQQHCASGQENCHTHFLQTWTGVASGSFVAPDHEYPSYLELELTVTDANGLTGVVKRRLDPKTVELTFDTVPSGLQLSVGAFSGAAPFTRTVIVGSNQSVSAPAPQGLNGRSYAFGSWSDGGAQNHAIVAPASATTYSARFDELATAPGLVGAWGFDEASGDQALDSAGRAGAGAISGAARAAGRFGGGLAFDGVNDWVTVADTAALRLTSGMTLEAWVNPATATPRWATAVMKERPSQLAYALYASDGANRAAGFVTTGSDVGVLSPAGALPLNTWTHLAATYDGATLRLYVNGAQVSSRPVSGAIASSAGSPLRFGGNGSWSDEFFEGRLDEIRVYERALTPAEIAVDMATPITGGAPAPRLSVTPATLSFSATQGAANPAAQSLAVANAGGGSLAFSVADDAPWLSVTPASGSGPRDLSASVDIAGLAPGTYNATVTVTATGAQGSPATIPVTLVVAPAPVPTLAVSPATLSFSATAGGAAPAAKTLSVSGVPSFTATDDAPWLSVTPASGTAPATLSVTANPAGLAAGTYDATVTVTAAGAAGSPKTVPVTFTVSSSTPATGLVAAYGFEEASGTTVADASPAGNPGVISGATRIAAGRFGSALSFDGLDDWVTVADANSLDLTTAGTLEAWVYPTALVGAWRTVMLKERTGAGLGYALYAADDGNRPVSYGFTGADQAVRGTAALPLNAWTHLAATYSGGTMRLYVNGTQVASRAIGSPIRATTLPLRIGGNAIWDEWFQGRIDDVRVYNRALSATEVQADMNTGVG